MGDSLSEVVVTARRMEEWLQNVPISITVFNQQQLADRNVVTAADLAALLRLCLTRRPGWRPLLRGLSRR